MISIPRSWARDLRAVFRRLSPGRNSLPQAVELTVDRNVLIARYTASDGVAEFCHASPQSNAQIVVPLDALADCEGKDQSEVTFNTPTEKQVEVRWIQNGVPQVRSYDAPEMRPAFPEPPAEWKRNSLELLDALDEAVKTTADSGTRYALDRIQFKGATGDVIASDSKQLLIQGGFAFPWQDDVLISHIGASTARAIGRVDAIQVGRTEGFIWLRTGPWSLALPIDSVGRYPDVMAIIPSSKADTRLVLNPADADTLVAVLPDLPGVEEPFHPVTVDLNGSVAVRAKDVGQAQATELVLDRSQVLGPAMRFVMDRNHLSRVRKLGFDTVRVISPSRPLVCRNGQRTFVMMPLDEKSAIAPSDDVLRVGEAERISNPQATSIAKAPAMTNPSAKTASTAAPMASTKPAKPKQAALGNSPIEEAAAIQTDLRNVLGRVRGLSALIRRQRKQHRLVKTTLDSLRQLQHVGG